jgi:hypothetical protein
MSPRGGWSGSTSTLIRRGRRCTASTQSPVTLLALELARTPLKDRLRDFGPCLGRDAGRAERRAPAGRHPPAPGRSDMGRGATRASAGARLDRLVLGHLHLDDAAREVGIPRGCAKALSVAVSRPAVSPGVPAAGREEERGPSARASSAERPSARSEPRQSPRRVSRPRSCDLVLLGLSILKVRRDPHQRPLHRRPVGLVNAVERPFVDLGGHGAHPLD